MATVLISKALIESVETNISVIKGKEYEGLVQPLDPYTNNRQVTNEEVFDLLHKAIWGAQIHLKDQIPDSWCTGSNKCQFIPTKTTLNGVEEAQSFNCIAPSGKRFKFPPQFNEYYNKPRLDAAQCQWVRELFPRVEAFNQAKSALTDKYAAVTKQVVGFLRSSKSLNQAVKAFPNLLFYIDQEYKDRLEEVVVRAPRAAREKQEQEKAVATLDVDLISSVGVLAVLQQAA